MILANKNIVIFGLLNQRSLAYFLAKGCLAQGANVALTFAEDRFVTRMGDDEVIKACTLLEKCDITKTEDLHRVKEKLQDKWPKIDGIIHSAAFAPITAFEKKFSEITYEEFSIAQQVSSYSLIEMARVYSSLMSDGGSILALTYNGSHRIVKGYNLMGVAKASLEAIVRYLADELGANKIRVNAISPGPVKTMAASAVGGLRGALDLVETQAPLKENISGDDVAGFATFLLSDLSKHVTGGTHFVDSGINLVGL